MEVEGDVWQRFVSSLVSSSEEAKQSGDALSPEDAAWVDSCLVNDPEISDDNWNAFKDALLDILSLQPTSPYEASASESEGFPEAIYDNHDPMSEESGPAEFLGRTVDDLVPINVKAETVEFLGETDDDLLPIGEKTAAAQFQGYFRKGFLSNYRDLEEKEYIDVEVDMGSENEIEASSENIFRVWDLDTWTEEDELVQELRKALAESSVQDASLTADVSFSGRGKETLDDIISGIADLSLSPSSS
ncbi:hypothetical protein BVC80_1805g94 [Macleaya cordata]|uniref:Uncharacterized protein n=1 Tax=Macleaya cordata TaxID=56857 RepID=A0A200QR06_MACCD|nr:hypothetical protein BVC80_1805g94 [Macleaya cordata]